MKYYYKDEALPPPVVPAALSQLTVIEASRVPTRIAIILKQAATK